MGLLALLLSVSLGATSAAPLPVPSSAAGLPALSSTLPPSPVVVRAAATSNVSGEYFGARYYGSRIGRFTTVDPKVNLKASTPNPQRWNRYSYGLNNPLRFTDPDGREVPVVVDGKMYNMGLEGGPALTQQQATVAAAVYGSGFVGGLALAFLAPQTIASVTTGSVVLGETMPRVEPVAEQLGAKTFQAPWTSFADVLAKNAAWLKEQMASGNRIYDIGLDAARATRSDFYAAETKALQAAGYARQYVRDVKVGEVVQKVYEWVRPASEAAK